MQFINNAIRKTLARMGYELHRASDQHVNFENFVSLTQAYEERLNELGMSVPQNELRSRLMARLRGPPPPEAYYIVVALAQTAGLAGDVCEFGVAQGETSALIANEITAGKKSFHLFDSFEGLPKPTE